MDRFKFRVWDKTEQRLEYNDLGAYCNTDSGMISCYEDTSLMQCTGLKDNNGKAIFEGDICKKDDKLYQIVWIDKLAKYCAKVIKSDYALVRNMRFPLQQYVIEGTLNCDLEIIGNIYENTEIVSA